MPKRRRRTSQTRPRKRTRTSRAQSDYSAFSQDPGTLTLEKKFLDVTTNDADMATGAQIFNSGTQCVIAQGAGESQRIGRRVTITNINWRYLITLPSQDAMTECAEVVRVMCIWDKQANLATATAANVLSAANIYGFNNLDNINRFVVLHDKIHTINATAAIHTGAVIATGDRNEYFEMYKRCSIPIEYTGATGAIGEITSNNIFCMAITEDGDNTAVAFESIMRLRYTDG